jgi:hypothetical protein
MKGDQKKYKVFYCETSNDGTVGGSHSCMYNLIRHIDRNRYRFTVGIFSENQYVSKYKDLNIEVIIIPTVPPKKDGLFIIRKATNWYNLEYKLDKRISRILSENKFDLVLLNNTVYESKIFINAANRLRLPVISYERGIMQYRPDHIRATSKVQASIAVSKAIFQNMVERGFRSGTMELIYDGIDPSVSQVRSTEMRSRGIWEFHKVPGS